MRLIDADALIAEMHNIILEDGEDRRIFYEVIERQPTVQPDSKETSSTHKALDTISRQAAIDALGEEPEVWTGKDEYAQGLNNQWHYDRNAIKAVPSAEPEIIRCKDCSHRIINDHYGERGYLNIKGYCELDTGDPFELGRCAENDDWFCADAERRTDEIN